MKETTRSQPEPDADAEPVDMSEFVRQAAAATGSLYVDFTTGTIRLSGDPIPESTPPDAA